MNSNVSNKKNEKIPAKGIMALSCSHHSGEAQLLLVTFYHEFSRCVNDDSGGDLPCRAQHVVASVLEWSDDRGGEGVDVRQVWFADLSAKYRQGGLLSPCERDNEFVLEEIQKLFDSYKLEISFIRD